MAPRPTTMSRPPRQGGARKRTNTTSNNPLKQMTHGSHSNPMAAARWYAPVQEQTNGAAQTRVPASVEPNLSTDCQQSYLGDQLAGEVHCFSMAAIRYILRITSASERSRPEMGSSETTKRAWAFSPTLR